MLKKPVFNVKLKLKISQYSDLKRDSNTGALL